MHGKQYNLIVEVARDLKSRFRKSSGGWEPTMIYVSPEAINNYIEETGVAPIMICGVWWEVDTNLSGVSFYCR